MDTAEKLEQSEISKNKGTDYFKVCSPVPIFTMVYFGLSYFN